ncbi:hypothetical protein [Nocardioides sp. SYSU D00065]|uniref:hypothetical protein n=1 Tax=Nocardioides sp. SYSU D00065 TaxID=2817378 RepID=UPI001B329A06|nr:hypothetical protein [Nocardioides sp. SYSU D00065]
MSQSKLSKPLSALVAGCFVAGGAVAVVTGSSSAQAAPGGEARAASSAEAAPAAEARTPARPAASAGAASMHSPYVPDVPHVPADVSLAITPDGEARYFGRPGSIFNGPAAEVDATVTEWWADQMAQGVSPERADELLARR